MASFCKQCAKDVLDSDLNDFEDHGLVGEVLTVLCEGCGPTNVDAETGECIYDCERHHKPNAK